MTISSLISRSARTSFARPIVPQDGVTVLGVYLFLLLAIPSNLGVGALGGAGSPASIFGLVMLLWWVWDQIHRPRRIPRSQPAWSTLLIFCGCVLASYVVAALSPLPQLDMNGADRSLLRVASFAGVLLVGNDGVPGRDRMIVLLRRLVLFSALYASLGLVQFFTKASLVDGIQIPGLVATGDEALSVRSGFARAQATASHALEYSSVLSIALPIAITLALHDKSRPAARRWLPVAIIAFAALLSVSRSGLIGVVIGLAVLFPTWKPIVRRYALVVAAVGVAAVYVMIPGMAGTMVGLFSGVATDSSVTSRTNSFVIVTQMFAIHPLLGRGLGTLLPTYRILDDQYLVLLVEVGVVGLAAFLAILAVAMWSAISRRSPSDPLWHELGPALCASVAAGATLTLFFDSFSFLQASGLLLMVCGVCGGYRNLQRTSWPPAIWSRVASSTFPGRAFAGRSGASRVGKALGRRWYVTAAFLLLAMPVLFMAKRTPGVYYTSFDMTFLAPPGATAGNPLWTGPGGLVEYAGIIQRLVEGSDDRAVIETVSAPLYGAGIRSGERITLPNSGSQWWPAYGQPELVVEVVAPSPEQVRNEAVKVAQQIRAAAAIPQQDMGVARQAYITTEQTPSRLTVSYIDVRRSRAIAALVALAGGLGVAGAVFADRASRLRRRLSGASHSVTVRTTAQVGGSR